MKLALYIEEKRQDVMGLDFVYNNLFQAQCLMKNAIEKLKLENQLKMRGKEWKIFLICKSKME